MAWVLVSLCKIDCLQVLEDLQVKWATLFCNSEGHAVLAVAVGALMLIAMDRETRWSLGREVRKFKNLDDGDVRFGVQIMGIDASPVRLTPRPGDEQANNSLIGSVTGLFVGRYEDPTKQDLLLISASALASARRYEIKAGTKRTAIRTTLPVQSAGAWALIQFEEEE